jgi:Tfp pilus assembly protein PilF
MSDPKKSKPRPLLPLIVFVAICVVLAVVVMKRPSDISSPMPEAGGTNTGRTKFALTLTNATPQSAEDRTTALVNEGNQFLAQAKFAEAAQKFEQAVATSPEQEDLHYNYAIALARLGKTNEAKKEYEEALRIFPDYAEALNNLGNMLMAEGKLDEATARLREAVKNAPDNSAFHNNLGTALGRQKKITEAMAEFEEAVKKDPTFVQARVNLANSLLATSRVEEAIEQLNEALRIKPDFGPALQTMQRARQRLGK